MKLDDIFNKLEQHDHDTYFVGGYVRDKLLGVKPKDVDLVTQATPDEMRSIFGEEARDTNNGAAFGTLMIQTDDCGLVEITTMRNDIGKGRHQTEVVFGRDLVADLARRDFTVNAIAMDCNGEMIDPFGGITAAEQRELIAVGDPVERLEEDELRALRAVYLSAAYGFGMNRELVKALDNFEIKNVHHNAAWTVIEKGFKVNPADTIILLNEFGFLEQILPEVADLKGCEHDPEHHPEGDAFRHTLVALEYGKDRRYNLQTLLCILVHDIGKPTVRDGTSYPGHDVAGEAIIDGMFRRLGIPIRVRECAKYVCRNHMRMHVIEDMRKGKRAALYTHPFWWYLFETHCADTQTHRETSDRIADIMHEAIEVQDRARFKPLIDGHDIIDILGYEGREIGIVKKALHAMQLAGHIGKREEALSILEMMKI